MKDKVVIITGASSGIGKACAAVFGQAGAKVIFTGRNDASLQETSKNLTAAGIDNLPICGRCQPGGRQQTDGRRNPSKYGKIDILINNAGISMRACLQTWNWLFLKK
jgi:dehydrogenase/reductase SDR family protein 7B